MSAVADPFGRAEVTAQEWLAVVCRELGTEDRVLAHRVLRAWLHVVRDRLPAGAGWPVPYDVAEFCERFAGEEGIHQSQVTDAPDSSCSAGNPGHVLASLPRPLSTLLAPVASEPI